MKARLSGRIRNNPKNHLGVDSKGRLHWRTNAAFQLDLAKRIASAAHRGQLRKHGNQEPYIMHVAAVAAAARKSGGIVAETVAWLHDVVEDSPSWTIERLQASGFDAAVVAAVDAITRRPGETYPDFISRVAKNPLARKVKLADLEHNSAGLPAGHHLLPRYASARQQLIAVAGGQ